MCNYVLNTMGRDISATAIFSLVIWHDCDNSNHGEFIAHCFNVYTTDQIILCPQNLFKPTHGSAL